MIFNEKSRFEGGFKNHAFRFGFLGFFCKKPIFLKGKPPFHKDVPAVTTIRLATSDRGAFVHSERQALAIASLAAMVI